MIKTYFFSLVISILFLPSLVVAEEIVSGQKLEHLSDELQLSSEQKARLEAIFNEKHEKIRAIREETQQRVKAVLSDEQLLKWQSEKRLSYDHFHNSAEDNP